MYPSKHCVIFLIHPILQEMMRIPRIELDDPNMAMMMAPIVSTREHFHPEWLLIHHVQHHAHLGAHSTLTRAIVVAPVKSETKDMAKRETELRREVVKSDIVT